jgi:Membrane protein involved in the export of O-antigen and teichoic acid
MKNLIRNLKKLLRDYSNILELPEEQKKYNILTFEGFTMTENSSCRTKNTKRNLISGLIGRITSILLPFLIRTVILKYMGLEYTGLSSLFTSILQVLNLAELGISSAIIFSMYKPIVEGDYETIYALTAYYKQTYRTIGIVILICGLGLAPFLNYLIHGSWPSDINIYILYLIYLFNTVISYFLFAYKSALLDAYQRIDIVNTVQLLTTTVQYVLQLVLLIAFRNYYIYIIVTPISTVVCNLITSYMANKYYPDIQYRSNLDNSKKKEIRKQVGGLLIGKFSDISRNSFDSIILSAMFGLTTVAIYNNYYYIYNSVYCIMLAITNAMQASIGNSIAAASKEKNYQDLLKFSFIFHWIIVICTGTLICLYQPFMELWVGKNFMLDEFNMILFVIYFYSININNTRNLYFSGKGMWWDGKKIFFLEALFNLILNIVLGAKFGVSGVLFATIFTIIVFNFILRTNLLFGKYFMKSPSEFFKMHFKHALQAVVICILSYIICGYIGINGLFGLIVKAICCFGVCNICLLLMNLQSPLFSAAIELAKKTIGVK